ncbi:MAG: hypothetical protein KGH53_03905 [Candidatus Micrarchaeota archaeon]|nr:hypothetical protein [Candidatus Micrarchaeota archaeon]
MTLQVPQKWVPFEGQVARTRMLIEQKGPLFYDDIQRAFGVTKATAGNYVRAIRDDFKIYSLHFTTTKKKHTVDELFTSRIHDFKNRAIVMDPENMDHLERLYLMLKNCLRERYTQDERAAISNRFKNVVPVPVYNLLVIELRRRQK